MNLFYFGISSGSAALISQFWGAKEEKHIRSSYGVALIFGTGVALVAFAAMFFFPDQLIRVFSNEAPVIAEARKYMRIVAFMGLFSSFNHRRDNDIAKRRDHSGVNKLSAGDKQLLQRYRQGELRHVFEKVFVVHFFSFSKAIVT